MDIRSWHGDLWVFGYGSLMWNPGFPYLEARPALLRGRRRRLCTWSVRYRGTPAAPGLVLGLDAGGACRGMAFRVSPAEQQGVIDYLFERELIYPVYEPRRMRVQTAGGAVPALTFVVNRRDPGYAGDLSEEERVRIVATRAGIAGSDRDYLAHTLDLLGQMGVHEPALAATLAAVDAYRERGARAS